jgi:hypothetical protein
MIADANADERRYSREDSMQSSQGSVGAAQQISSSWDLGFPGEGVRERAGDSAQAGGLQVHQQVPVKVTYEGHVVGDYLPDLIVRENDHRVKRFHLLPPASISNA